MSEAEQGATWARVECLTRDADSGSDWLWAAGAQGVEVRDAETFFEGDPEYAPIPDGRARLVAYFELFDGEDAAALDARLREDLEEVEHTSLVAAARFDDRSWATKWREFFTPRNLSPSAIVGPPWEDFEAPEGGHKIIVEPGMAFGTGTHETTQLVSRVLEEYVASQRTPPARMLDVGCGSGILCILAHKLGVHDLTGVDITMDSIENARHNLTLNDLGDATIDFSTTPLADLEGTWPLVVANILAHILISLREELIAHTSPGGTLILSGIIAAQLGDIRQAFIRQGGMREVEERQFGDWFSLEMVRPEES